MSTEIMEKVEHLMETAEYEAESVFDRVTVVKAKLENGMTLINVHVSESPEAFNPEEGVEECVRAMWADVAAMEQDKNWEPSLTEQQAQIIVALADNNLKVTETAKATNYTPQSVRNQVKKIREYTGKDPMSFFGMCELLLEARAVLAAEE